MQVPWLIINIKKIIMCCPLIDLKKIRTAGAQGNMNKNKNI